jgi:hypothetical protein
MAMIAASVVEELGTPLFQFVPLNQSPLAPIQVVVVASARGGCESAKQQSTSGMKSRPRRKSDRLIEFLRDRVVIFFVVSLLRLVGFEGNGPWRGLWRPRFSCLVGELLPPG